MAAEQAGATAPNGPLAWESPHAVGMALKDKKTEKKKFQKKENVSKITTQSKILRAHILSNGQSNQQKMKNKYFTYVNMCSILYKCKVPGED